MAKVDSLPDFYAPDRAVWRAWLAVHHAQAAGVWLVRSKLGSGEPVLSYAEAVEEALCFGWIDSLPRKLDEHRTKLLFTPRKPRSAWSRPNKERVARLIEAGLMAPAGLAAIGAAQATGSWEALDAIEDLTMPVVLMDALGALPAAAEAFAGFPASAKKAMYWWIASAKRPETAERRIAAVLRLAASQPDAVAIREWLLRPGSR